MATGRLHVRPASSDDTFLFVEQWAHADHTISKLIAASWQGNTLIVVIVVRKERRGNEESEKEGERENGISES